MFDLFGTLTDWDREVQRRVLCDDLATLLGVENDELFGLFVATFTDRAAGRTGDTTATVQLLADRLGVRPDQSAIASAVLRRIAHERFLVEPTPAAVEILTTLRSQGYRLGVCSDCSSETPEIWPDLPYATLVDAAVFSYDIGVRKPDRRMYEAIAGALAVEPGDCLYIGDGSSHELTGAQASGMTAVKLATCVDSDLQFDRDAAWRGPQIMSLHEVAGLVTAGRPD